VVVDYKTDQQPTLTSCARNTSFRAALTPWLSNKPRRPVIEVVLMLATTALTAADAAAAAAVDAVTDPVTDSPSSAPTLVHIVVDDDLRRRVRARVAAATADGVVAPQPLRESL